MAINKPTTPSATLPDNWGGTQTAYTSSQIQNGYEEAVPQIVDGGNINYEKKGLFTNIKYLRTIVDFIRNTPIGKTLFVNSNNQLDYIAPADDTNTVHKTGNEEIGGTKTFTANPIIKDSSPRYLLNNTNDDTSVTPGSTVSCYPMIVYDKNNQQMSYFRQQHVNNGGVYMGMLAGVGTDSNRKTAGIDVRVFPDGTSYATCPTPTEDTTTSSQADTVGARNTKINSTRTNCITEIPQDIKLELNNGTLTLKAGSKVYVPNGFNGTTPKFDVVTLQSDINNLIYESATQAFQIYNPINKVFFSRSRTQICSGASPISGTYVIWYDTVNNLVKSTSDGGSTWVSGLALPISIATSDGSSYTSIDQVFNGFGYIGSTVFALPGVKGLIPYDRNVDGSLKNLEFTVSRVVMVNNPAGVSATKGIGLSQTTIAYWGGNFTNVDSLPTTNIINFKRYYVIPENTIYVYNGTQWIKERDLYVGQFSSDSTGRITSFTTNTPFHAVDYNDFERELNNKADKSEVWTPSSSTSTQKETVVGWGIPNYEASYTLGAFPFTAPKKCLFTGYVNTVGVYADLYANINGVNIKVTNTNAYTHSSFYFVLDKGDVITFANYVTASNCTIIPLKGAN